MLSFNFLGVNANHNTDKVAHHYLIRKLIVIFQFTFAVISPFGQVLGIYLGL